MTISTKKYNFVKFILLRVFEPMILSAQVATRSPKIVINCCETEHRMANNNVGDE